MEVTEATISLYQKYLHDHSVTTDSRNVPPGAIFFALRGPNFNGNAFAAIALEKGASYVVIDDPQYYQDNSRYIWVDDVLTTLYSLANYHRKKFAIPVIGITGSCGKTTTKDLITVVLSKKYKLAVTQGNLNTVIGVSLTLLAMPINTEIAVIEMGASALGEIALLCQIAMPTYGLITNIGPAHLEGFGSMAGVLRGKSELYDYLLKNNGNIFFNTLDPLLANMAQRFSEPISYPQSKDFCSLSIVDENPFIQYKDEKGVLVNTHLLGKSSFDNMAAAICIGKYFGLPAMQVNQAIQNYMPTNNRTQLVKQGSNQILLDAYNANPMSVKSALYTLQKFPSLHKVVILGDMGELGNLGQQLHQDIVQLTATTHFQLVLLCGPQMVAARLYNLNAHYFDTKEALATYLMQQKFDQSTILIKGSRFLSLETLVYSF